MASPLNRGQVRFAATARMILPPTTEALFTELGLGLRLAEASDARLVEPDLVCARVDVSALKLTGSLTLLMPRKTVTALTPNVSSHPEDWVAELCNQVAGRFSNRFGRRGVSLKTQPPVRCAPTDAPAPPGAADPGQAATELRWLFRADDHAAVLALQFEVESDFQFADRPAPAGTGGTIGEGQLIIFGD